MQKKSCAHFPDRNCQGSGHLEPRVQGQPGNGRAGPWGEESAFPVRASSFTFKLTGISSCVSAQPHPHDPAQTFQGCVWPPFPQWTWSQPQTMCQNPGLALAHLTPQGGAHCPALALPCVPRCPAPVCQALPLLAMGIPNPRKGARSTVELSRAM